MKARLCFTLVFDQPVEKHGAFHQAIGFTTRVNDPPHAPLHGGLFSFFCFEIGINADDEPGKLNMGYALALLSAGGGATVYV